MPTRILLAPVGAGKTETILNRLVNTLNMQPLAKVWALLASRRQTDAFRQRLIDWETGRHVFFNVEFFDFYRLYQYLLDEAGSAQRTLTDAAQLNVLRAVIQEHTAELTVYRTIAHTPGFAHIISDFITELKQNQITPQQYQAATSSPKDHDLARIYSAYQDYLRVHNLMDNEGQGWLAADALAEHPTVAGDIALLLVDGFDHFTPVQLRILQQLAKRSDETLITLTTVTGREATVGRRFRQALENLQATWDDESLVIENLSDTASQDRHPDLRHIINHIFLQDIAPINSQGGVHFIEAPDTAAEVGAVLRKVKRLLLENNDVLPDHILIALRDWRRYQIHFAAMKHKYQLPLALHYGEPLAENPAMVALLKLLQLHKNDFRRRDLLDVLRSPYITLPDHLDVMHLERISRTYAVSGGREQWLQAIHRAHASRKDEDEGVQEALLDAATAETLADALATVFDAITPPEQATLTDYAAWLETLIGDDPQIDPDDEKDNGETVEAADDCGYCAEVMVCLRDKRAPQEIITRDLAAMKTFKRVLAGMLAAQELAYSVTDAEQPLMTWEAFYLDITSAVGNASVNPQPSRFGQVLVTSASNARGLPHKHVFILGLSEGLFPAQTPEDPLHLDTERQALQAAGIPLQTRIERRADDGLFYELVCLPRESVTFSRPTVKDGQPWIASPLLRAAADLFADAAGLSQQGRLKVGDVVALENVASKDEAVVALSAGLNQPLVAQPENVPSVMAWLQETYPDYWAHIRNGRQIENGRMSPAPHNEYTGVLNDGALIAYVSEKLDGRRRWSASQFNDFGACGFRFFAKRLLKLEALRDPEEGMDAAQWGTLNHKILERTYLQLQQENAPIIPENLAETLNVLREIAAEVLADAPKTLGFRQSALWEHEKAIILRKLEKLVELDFTGSPISKKFGDVVRIPYQQEVAFGFPDRVTVKIDLGDEVGAVTVRGFIDRIDRQGNAIIVIDYKTGSMGISVTEMQEGRNFQMMVYLLAAEKILAEQKNGPTQVKGGAFWHISNRSLSGAVEMDGKGQDSIEQAKAHLANHIARGRRGDFAVQPNKPDPNRCARYCDFHEFCRVSITHRYKAIPE